MANTFVLIGSATVGAGGASSIDFTSIPATYTDLLLNISARNNFGGNDATRILLRFNGATNDTNQFFRRLYGDGATVTGDTGSEGHVAWMSQNGSTANTFSNVEVYIPNYTQTSNQKNYIASGGNERNISTTVYEGFFANRWADTSAINAIKILSGSSYNLVQYTTAYLYGISNA